jgi:integrase
MTNSRGSGRIFRRKGTNNWWMAYYLRGEEYRESAETSDEKKALTNLRYRIKEVGADQLGIKKFVGPAQQRITVNQLLDALQVDYELRGKSNRQFLSSLKPLRERFGTMRAMELSSEMIDAFVKAALQHGRRGKDGKPAKPATVNRSTQLLGAAFKLAVSNRRLSSTPVIRRLSEVGNARSGFFSGLEFRSVLANLPEYLRDMTLFGYLTGWRAGEIKSLSWPDLDGDTIRLRAENSKNRCSRNVPLVGELAELIERRRLQMSLQTSLIFHHDGQRIVDFRKAWRTACRLAGVNRLFHDLRRTAVRDMIRSGTPESVAMTISGHRTRSMFDRYNITDDRDLRAALLDRQSYSAHEEERAVISTAEVVQ